VEDAKATKAHQGRLKECIVAPQLGAQRCGEGWSDDGATGTFEPERARRIRNEVKAAHGVVHGAHIERGAVGAGGDGAR
jgi:hypothetical protein